MKKKESKIKLKKEDNRNILIILGVVAGFIVLVVLLVWANQSSVQSNSDNSQQNNGNYQNLEKKAPTPSCKDVQVPYDDIEYYTDTEPYTDSQCDSKVLVYSITDFNFVSSVCNNKVEECTSYTLGFCTSKNVYCTDRTVICSLKVNNLDDERGSWTINFNFMKSGTSSVSATDPASLWLYPHTSDTTSGSGRITTKEAYDSQYTCSYGVQNEPTKQVCHDVIKYRDVQKQRTVTKYRTEQQCN